MEILVKATQLVGSTVAVNTIACVGSIASVFALFQAGRVWRRMREMELSYLQQRFLPEYAKRLRIHEKSLKTARSQKNRHNAVSQLARCESNLLSTEQHLKRAFRRRVATVRQEVKTLRSGSPDDAAFFAGVSTVVADIGSVRQSIDNLVEEQPWRRTNAN